MLPEGEIVILPEKLASFYGFHQVGKDPFRYAC